MIYAVRHWQGTREQEDCHSRNEDHYALDQGMSMAALKFYRLDLHTMMQAKKP